MLHRSVTLIRKLVCIRPNRSVSWVLATVCLCMDGQLPFKVISFLDRGRYLLNSRGWWGFRGGVRLA
jgi:hypothetical protein